MDIATQQYHDNLSELSDEQQQELSQLINTPITESTKVNIPVIEVKECKLDDPECEVCSS